MTIQKIYIGGWFQRTTLHLTEIWDFLNRGKSNLDFPKEKLSEARASLSLSSVSRESGPLEYILVKTKKEIGYRIYEDGLIILEKDFESLKNDFEAIKDYYDNKLSKALSLIFSKGAPVPKELVNIKTILPYIVTVDDATKKETKQIFKDFSEEVYSTLTTKNIEVYHAPGIILINNLKDEKLVREVIESQIFFREFKSQLHRYLAIHRILWEKIRTIKERGEIKGNEVDSLRNELSVYQKTINLIGARIDQMPAYVKTRQKITNVEKIDDYLQPLFQFKFETLLDTHEYIKHLWGMTKNYLTSAIEIFSELQTKSTKNTISSLQLITTIGVVAGILTYLGKDTLPKFTSIGLIYFFLLMIMTWVINSIVSKFFKNKKYNIEGQDIEKDIK
ncbi:hypothetical protein A2627_05040 [Candidatus Woesebacteria bacterium RIFCSPHIGHO2_01_FULL_39_28]|uniref:Uncharacterized protein n=1 Tax=Candidatus Woesebacteria bacterium RIFCSPHIGHO2_01_FULL_39_28 TaxID=1802496 RepID=A0A1F7YCH6_9BACT|nr:MAG: hypothetical protein A2627_05040 [Candidatus Woesebacteria bacterium RIFCSPHIGHO2_01_FULL_39_28]OGM57558.1 MAG: hypothetical protein A3A50_06155 [Candidatus Woesebacteria bacterium RIFCSPLOWO2_01_FULL_38_20]